MWDFIILLLFSKTVLLTSNFVDIDHGIENYKLNLDKPISAITSGASIQIDVSQMVSKDINNHDLLAIRRAVSEKFPEGSIEAILTANNMKVNLVYQGGVLLNNDSSRLVLSGNEIPTGVNFSTIEIKTKLKLERIKIFWKNYKK